MAEWLFEIFSEEIPARMQKGAQEQLKELTKKHLEDAELPFETITAFVTPRRLTVVVDGLPLQTSERIEEKKGPREDAPQTVIDGFLRTANVRRDECEVRETPKGIFLFVLKKVPSQHTREILSQIAPSLLQQFRWSKSMRWGSLSTTWVRPIRGLLSIFEAEVVPFSYAEVEASNQTHGHRFLAPGPFTVDNFKDYNQKLKDHKVILDWEKRRELIKDEINKMAQEAGLTPYEDEDLLDEVAGLVEWPIALKGEVDAHFMELPPEVITTPMRVHQRYFPFVDAQGKLSPYFGIIANMETRDKGKTTITGNERVLRARLADAQFFWEQDLKKPLESFNSALKTRLFHQQLGSVFGKVERLVKLSSYIATQVGADPETVEHVKRAALLSKADLASQMVGEFPELQGIMGRYYALNQEENSEVACAIEEHYWPKGSDGALPKAIPSLILAIADRLDTLMGFFAIGITPTGSKDPFALRRAALNLISLSLQLSDIIPSFAHHSILDFLRCAYDIYPWSELAPSDLKNREEATHDLWKFLVLERFKFVLRESRRYDHVDAVLSIADHNSSFLMLELRAQALDGFMTGENGKNLLIAYKRASNIVKIEEAKDKQSYEGDVSEDLLEQKEEKDLFKNLNKKYIEIQELIQNKDFLKGSFFTAVEKLAELRQPVDEFFDKVKVNDPRDEIRENRLKLLALLRKTMHQIADFSKIEG